MEVFGAIRAAVAQTSDAAVMTGSMMKQRAVLAGRTGAVIADASSIRCTCCCALSHGGTWQLPNRWRRRASLLAPLAL